MRLSLPFALIVLTGCVSAPRPSTPLGVDTRIMCEPSAASGGTPARYPRIALSDTTAFVETTLGVSEHRLSSRTDGENGVKYKWPTGDAEVAQLEIDANGGGFMFAVDPQIYDEQNMQRKALYLAFKIKYGTYFACKKVA